MSHLSHHNPKVIIGISGGVDSAVAALLLKEQGYNVEAAFMKNWETERDDPYCSADQDLADARAVCDLLQIPLHTVNFSAEYWQRVFQYMLDEYAAGRTPNPDVMCNKEIKFGRFLEYAKNELHADLIATGHYARCVMVNDNTANNIGVCVSSRTNSPHMETPRLGVSTTNPGVSPYPVETPYRASHNRASHNMGASTHKLLKGVDQEKDQSYFLYTLTQEQLSLTLFPIGGLKKSAVREIAQKAKLPNFAKKDSTGVCFIGERKFKDFLGEYLLAKPGTIVNAANGEELGRHDGLMFYTLGQRQGLKIGGQKNAVEAPWYVVEKDLKNNRLIVAQQHDHPLLLSSTLHCSQVHWIAGGKPHSSAFPLACRAKTRYRQADQACTVTMLEDNADTYRVEFAIPQRAITPGQSVVFYAGDECLGGGIIL